MDDMEALALAAAAAKRKAGQQPAQRNPDGTYGQPPEGMFYNPQTGQMTERPLIKEHVSRQGVSNLGSFMAGAGRGASFGGVDELAGGVNALIPGKGTAQERYVAGREMARAREEAAQEANPNFFLGGEVTGGVSAAAPYSVPLMAGRSLGGAAVVGAGLGAAEGTAYGALTGESPEERARQALTYGTAGLALGGALPVATAGVQKAAGAVGDVIGGGIDAVRGRASQSRANRAIVQALTKSGKTERDVASALQAAAREGQPEYRVMDALGITGQRKASALARSGGDASAEIAEFLEKRQLDQPERVAGFVEDAFDLAGTTARQTREGLRKGRDAAADINFGAIRATNEPVDIRNVLNVIDSKAGPFINADIDSPARNALTSLRRQLAGQSDDASYELSNFDKVFAIRKQLRDDISAAYRAGRNELGKDLSAVKSALDDALASANPTYRQAMQDFAQSSRVMDATQTGAEMARPGNRAADTVAQFQALSPNEQAAARVGYGDRALAKLEAQAGGANRARPLTSTKAMTEAEALATDPGLYQRRVGREMEMFETRAKALGGSRTADNQADIAEMAGFDAGPIVNLLRGNLTEAAIQAGQRGINAATGMNQGTRQLIAQALMSGDTRAVSQAVQQVQQANLGASTRRAIVDALLRSVAVQNSAPLQRGVGLVQ